jgi:hypothetical protein
MKTKVSLLFLTSLLLSLNCLLSLKLSTMKMNSLASGKEAEQNDLNTDLVTIENKTEGNLINNLTNNLTGTDLQFSSSYSGNSTYVSEVRDLLKNIISKVDDLITRTSLSNSLKDDLKNKLHELRTLWEKVFHHYDLVNTRNKYQLDSLSHTLIAQLEGGLIADLVMLQKNIEKQNQKLRQDDIEIEEMKTFLPDPNKICQNLQICSTCVANPQCGWCSSSNSCVEGNQNGPLKSNCPVYDYEKCSDSSDCSTYTKCSECIKNVGCGWCNDMNINTQICLKKSEGEGENPLCNAAHFHHIWKKEKDLASCPKVTMRNFIKLVESGLHESNIIPSSRDTLYSNYDYDEINETLLKLKNKLNAKIDEQIALDRFLREYKKTNETLIDLKKQMTDLDDKMNLDISVKEEVFMQGLKDMEFMIQQNLQNPLKETQEIINNLFKEDYERFNKEKKELLEKKEKDKSQQEKNIIIKVNSTCYKNYTFTNDSNVNTINRIDTNLSEKIKLEDNSEATKNYSSSFFEIETGENHKNKLISFLDKIENFFLSIGEKLFEYFK